MSRLINFALILSCPIRSRDGLSIRPRLVSLSFLPKLDVSHDNFKRVLLPFGVAY